MNSRRLWDSHQRHKFLRAKASGDILKFRVSEMEFPGVFKGYFPLQTPCCFVRIHTILFEGDYLLLAIMVEGDESS